MSKSSSNDFNHLFKEIDSFLEEIDKSNAADESEQYLNSDPAKREKLINEMFHEEEPSLDGTFELHVSDDDMEVRIDCYPPHGEGELIRLEDVEKRLNQAEVAYGVDWKTLEETLFTCNTEREQQSGVLIAKGTPPTPEVPEHFLIKKKLLQNSDKRQPNSKEGIDYRERSPFIIVEEGEVLAKLQHIKQGKFGQTVKGEQIPYKSKHIVNLTPGENTEWRGDTVVSTCHGRFVSRTAIFGVKEILEITTDVDYHTGNIDFPGDVIIYGQVKDRFSIRTGGSLYCSSTLDAHRVTCEGDLLVNGGIIGRKEGVVKVKGKIECKFIENCYVEAGDSISIKTGLINSVINTKGMLTMGKRGTILGGKVFAQNGVIATQIGSPNQVQTEINCGVDFSVQNKLFWIKDNHLKLVEKKRKIEKELTRNKVDSQTLQNLKQEITQKIHKLSEASILLLDKLDKNDAAAVAVPGRIYSGGYIEICHTSFVVTTPLQSVKFTLNKRQGNITVDKL